MKALLSVVGVLGLAVVFGMSEPAPASTKPVTSDDVQLVSEQMSSHGGPHSVGKNARKNAYLRRATLPDVAGKNARKNGRNAFRFGPG